jgi:predicted phosphohydrolase
MQIQYASDLHLEFPDNRSYLAEHPLETEGDVLLLAGDICPFKTIDAYGWFFDRLAKNYQRTYWIPGNHEYYGTDLSEKCGSFCEPIRDNVFLVNDHAETIDGIRFIFSTLWTKISPMKRWAIERGMNDFRLIRFGHKLLNADIYNELHENSLGFIKQELRSSQKKVVMTHHIPTLQFYPPEYIGSSINQGFAVDLDNLILETEPDVWLYGHHHRNISEFNIGKTRMLTNQLGYVRAEEHLSFDPFACIEL